MDAPKSLEQERADLLAAQPSWFQKVLQLDYDLMSPEEKQAWANSDWWALNSAHQRLQQEYESILRRIPTEWKSHRRKLAALSPLLVPKGTPGRRPDSKAAEYLALHSTKSYRQMAKDELQAEPEGEAKQLLIEKERERLRQSVRRSRHRKNT